MNENRENHDEPGGRVAGLARYKAACLWPLIVVALYLYFNAGYFEAMVSKFAGFLQYIL